MISFLRTHEHGKRIIPIDNGTSPEATQVQLAKTIQDREEHDKKKFPWDTFSIRLYKDVSDHISIPHVTINRLVWTIRIATLPA